MENTNRENRMQEIEKLAAFLLDKLDGGMNEARELAEELVGNAVGDIALLMDYAEKAYSNNNLGCSKENPFIIRNTENHVPIEYDMMDALFALRHRNSELQHQQLVHDGDRKIDLLTFVVWPNGEEKQRTLECYFFDITAGYDAMAKRFRHKNK